MGVNGDSRDNAIKIAPSCARKKILI
jgi:hypothetical protein